jgi:hypothetical protein
MSMVDSGFDLNKTPREMDESFAAQDVIPEFHPRLDSPKVAPINQELMIDTNHHYNSDATKFKNIHISDIDMTSSSDRKLRKGLSKQIVPVATRDDNINPFFSLIQ